MKPDELFRRILTESYTHSGAGVDYRIDFDPADRTLYVLYQGSTTKSDWLHNFMFWPHFIEPYKHMETKWKAHAGIVRMWQSVRDEVIEQIVNLLELTEAKWIVVAGHSQGGGIAQLCAEDLAWNAMPCSCITYGSPKVFYGIEAKEHIMSHINKGQFINYENGSDIVSLLPPGAFSVRPRHVGEPFRLHNVMKTADYHMGYGNSDLYK